MMQTSAPTWERLKTNNVGDYWFEGPLRLSEEVKYRLSEKEIDAIHADIILMMSFGKGQCHTQIFHHPLRKETLFLIDNMTRKEKKQKNLSLNYSMLMFDYEYFREND